MSIGGLGYEIETKKSESKKNKSEKKEHKSHFKPSKEVSDEVSMEDLKHAPFPHRLTKASKANLNDEIYDTFKQVRINIHVKCH